MYNRKLKKYLKIFDNTQIIEVDSKRELFTSHGLHMNAKGKEQITRKIAQTIKVMVNKKKSDPIMMKDREDQRIFSEGTERIADVTQNEDKEAQTTHEEQAGSIHDPKEDKLPSKRTRKLPTT